MKRAKLGFTLAELLIVIAIVAVLVAIAIPVFTTQLERSRESVDLSNARAIYAEVMVAANSDDGTATINGATIKQADGTFMGMYSPLKQQKENWQLNKDGLTIGGVPYDAWEAKEPGEGGSFMVIFDPNEGTTKIYWRSFLQVLSAGQWKSMSHAEKLAADIGLRDALTKKLSSMTYQEIFDMLNEDSPKKESWNGTCYTLASSLIDMESGELGSDGRNEVYTKKLFESIGYDLSNPEHQYLINSWGYNPNATWNGNVDDLYIKVDIGANVDKMVNSGQGDKKPTNVIVYLNGNGINTKNDPNFGHNRKN